MMRKIFHKSFIILVVAITSLVVFFLAGELILRTPIFPWRKDLDAYRHFAYTPPKSDDALRTFRTPFSMQKKKGTRILVLGDSYSWGDKIKNDADVWPSVLESVLNQNPHRAFEVVNMSLMGVTTVNELEVLQKKGWAASPDLLMLQFNLNDPLPSGDGLRRAGESWLFNVQDLIRSDEIHQKMTEMSYFYAFVNDRFRKLQLKLFFADGYRPLYADNFVGWRQCQLAIHLMSEEAKVRGVPFVVILFPAFPPGKYTQETYPYADLHRIISEAVKKTDASILDLVGAFTDKDLREWWALQLDAHPGKDAHALAAREIYSYLNKQGYLAVK